MKLTAWMKQHGKIAQDVADGTGRSVHTVESWMQGRSRPNRRNQRDLTAYTGGEVTANDFMDDAA
jgi:transcriptional regulator with XRE-family HTH domain